MMVLLTEYEIKIQEINKKNKCRLERSLKKKYTYYRVNFNN